jgi:hypothetical protein
MKEDRPFLEDGSQFGVSRTGFRRVRKAEKRELMIQWFHENFEDPVKRTPYESAEGGYQWIWGGPYNAGEQLFSKFGDIVPESLIEEVAEELEKHGLVDWAPTPSRDDYDDDEPPPEPISLDVFLDKPSDRYGTPEDHEARARVRTALGHLRDVLDRPRPVGIGHNRPPEDIEEEPEEIKELRPALIELRAEFSKPNPAISLVKRWAQPLRDAVIASGTWAARKLDKAIDAAATVGGGGIAVGIGAHYSESLHSALDAVIKWLEIAARHVF